MKLIQNKKFAKNYIIYHKLIIKVFLIYQYLTL